MKRYRIKKRFPLLIIISVLLVLLLVQGCSDDTGQKSPTAGKIGKTQYETIELLCVGDIMAHGTQIKAQYDPSTGEYDFNNNYKYVKPYIEKADVAMCNLETTFGGEPYRGYPVFSAPDSLADAIKNAGFDVVFTSNNHMMDTGMKGVKRTLGVLRDKGFDVSGSRLSEEEPRFFIRDVKGVKVGFIGYTYETPSPDGNVYINSIKVPYEEAELINSFSNERIKADLKEMKDSVTAAKKAGADIVVMYLHWGEEYQQSPNPHQKTVAEYLIDNTATDIIFASHPHVLQPIDMIKSADGKKTVPVFYSMGNFISNQRVESLGERFANTETGCLAILDVKVKSKTVNGKKTYTIESIENKTVPTWVNRYASGGKTVYDVVPLDGTEQNNPGVKASGRGAHVKRVKEAANAVLNQYLHTQTAEN